MSNEFEQAVFEGLILDKDSAISGVEQEDVVNKASSEFVDDRIKNSITYKKDKISRYKLKQRIKNKEISLTNVDTQELLENPRLLRKANKKTKRIKQEEKHSTIKQARREALEIADKYIK